MSIPTRARRTQWRALLSIPWEGTTGNVSRSETYNAQSGQTQYSASKSATTQGGSTITHDTSASWGPKGDSASRDTTVTNAQTGQTHTSSSGYNGDDRYASADGQNYRNDGSGWQKQTASGWQSAGSEDTSWADREQQARSQGEDRVSSFSQGGFGAAVASAADLASRFGGGGGGGFGGGGFASRFGGGGGFGGRFGGGFRRSSVNLLLATESTEDAEIIVKIPCSSVDSLAIRLEKTIES